MMLRAVIAMLLAGGGLGCAGETGQPGPTEGDSLGTLALNLSGTDSGGRTYRLRNAEFRVSGYRYYPYDAPTATVTLSSETDPDAEFLETRLSPGEYQVSLANSLWYLERLTASGPERVDQAVLLSPVSQYVYLYQNETRDVTFTFGVDGELIDFRHGDLRIGIQILQPGEDADAGI